MKVIKTNFETNLINSENYNQDRRDYSKLQNQANMCPQGSVDS